MQKLLPALIISTIAASSALAAQVPAGTKLAPAEQQVINHIIRDNPRTLDPSNGEETIGHEIMAQMFEALTAVDADGNIIPGAATHWETSADKLTWTFHLRKGNLWSDGTPITATDFVTSWRRLVDPKNGFSYAFYLGDMAVVNAAAISEGKAPVESLGVKALDDYTFEVKLERPVPWLLEASVLPNLAPIPTKLFQAGAWPNNDKLVVNGPYKLVKHQINDKYELVANDKYWDHEHTVIQKITFHVVNQESAAFKRLQAGDVNMAELKISNYIEEAQRLIADKQVPWKILQRPGGRVTYWSFNQNIPPFKDNLALRKALTLVFDSKEIEQKVLRNAVVATTVLTAPYPGFSDLKEAAYFSQPYEQRIAEARTLLAQAGYSEANPLRFTMSYNNDDTYKRVAIAYQSQLKRAFGQAVELKLANSDWNNFLTERKAKTKLAFYRSGWGPDYSEPSTFYGIWTCDNPINDQGFCSAEYDKQWQTVYQTKSVAERAALYQKLNDLIVNDYATIVAYHALESLIVNKNLHGAHTDPIVRRMHNMYIVQED